MRTRAPSIAIIGGGVVGLATARALALRGFPVTLLEAEEELAMHQTGHNSGVIHAGLYYRPGSLKAENCGKGRHLLYDFCEAEGIPFERCGKLVVATSPEELPALDELERRGQANGLQGLRRLGPAEAREHEPHVQALAALYVPETGIVDYRVVCRHYATSAVALGAVLHRGARLFAQRRRNGTFHLETTAGTFRADAIINCAGLQCDRVAELFGQRPTVRIIPFRGEYYALRPELRSLVRGLIYPVPDARYPFLGVHFTRRIDGLMEAGPNAVLAWRREGYQRGDADAADALDTLTFPGFWRMAAQHWRAGVAETRRSYSPKLFLESLRKLVPDLPDDALLPGGSGVRAQAVHRTGKLIDDFLVERGPGQLHLLNAPSPAATASLAIADSLATEAEKQFTS